MSLWSRAGLIFKAKASKALDKAEDPREVLDYGYHKQLERLQQVRRSVADVATSRKRLELQVAQLRQQSERLHAQAEQAIEAGREDLAREALTRRSGLAPQIAELTEQHDALQADEEKLLLAQQRLTAQLESLRTRKETLKATYTAAEAQTRVNEAIAGIGDDMGDIGQALQRAHDKTDQMRARASAVDELLSSGALEDLTSTPGDDIAKQLDELSSKAEVEAELSRLKGLAAPAQAPAIEAPVIDVPVMEKPADRYETGPGQTPG